MDELGEAFLDIVLPLGPIHEHRSRFADKPAVFLGSREIAHCEPSGHLDLRITKKAWDSLRSEWGHDPAVNTRPGRRDWIELAVTSPDDIARLAPLIAAAVTANHQQTGILGS